VLRDFLRASIHPSAIPIDFIFVERLPLTLNGKVDRQLLSSLESAFAEKPKKFQQPPSALFATVAASWKEILEVETVEADDDFFGLGGDSLQAIKMTSQLQTKINAPVPLAALFFQEPTLGAFVRAIEIEIEEGELE
jgi:acyl carrier protein